jgi:hypothetical protein
MFGSCGADDSRFRELGHEGVRQHGRQPKRAQYVRRKVAGVESHDHIGNTGQGGSQDVSVIRIRQRQALLPALIPVNPTPQDMLVHEPTGPQ